MAQEKGTGKGRRMLDSWWGAALFAGVLWLVFGLLSHRGVASAIVSAVIYGGFMAASYGIRRRRVSRATGVEADELPRLARLARRGQVPEDPEQRRQMRRLVRWQLGRLHDMRRAVLAFGLLFLVFVGNTVLWFATGHAVAGLCWLAGGLAVLALAWWSRRRTEARLTRTDRRLNALDHGQPA
ncbi:hypothetical protein GA0115240_104614 [Streptomyces sp. DvalAA-14]|uniref:hypothetical protein n=1 Tax=unclassified Streptomyces TaxID=2593676 RepID=UPI00081B9848|nr:MULTISPECIES: hypothetical protein [unclassified Streptomyces]MYS19096.1 hypothetical protein [Streptomyces sp. SID4948]SCD36475.1 hypothetical protein GA0115240_104614 [Streptomyces sp. DvalAA-14]